MFIPARPLTRRHALVSGLAALLTLAPALRAAEPGAWLASGRPTAAAMQAVELLAHAGDHGLAPADYAATALAAAVSQASTHALPEPAAAELAQHIDASFRNYLIHLHQGRIDPRQIHHDFDTRRPRFDAAAVLQQALAQGQLAAAVAAAVPALPQYDRLRTALATCRALADHPAWQTPLPPAPARRNAAASAPASPVPADMPAAGRALLVQRLQAWGDLSAAPTPTATDHGDGTPAPASTGTATGITAGPDDATLAAALRRFQSRHGLAEDGLYGPATRRALQVTPAQRARQIELALERLRWTPLLQAPRMVVVNIPEYRLRAYEVVDGRIQVRQDMRVVVGGAMRHQTPLFDEDMRFIEFGPYWNVPPSIARQELVPRLRREPAYFAREELEFVGPGGAVEQVVTAERLQSVLAGTWRLRQRPGPHNALGGIKFVFPNHDAIYLHHTPATGLFAQARRDFSHGCIRVEDPVALAGFVLQGLPGWDAAAIRQTMATAHSRTVNLPRPVPVLIAYGTALVKEGRMHFFDDVYGHDRVLDSALRRASASGASP